MLPSRDLANPPMMRLETSNNIGSFWKCLRDVLNLRGQLSLITDRDDHRLKSRGCRTITTRKYALMNRIRSADILMVKSFGSM